uniref:RebB family R body protein n=1 Tax=Azospirillum formosense TaxID=861533 RepID=UPI0009A264A9
MPLGLTPSLAMDMTYVAMADSLGLAMQNAVANQQRAQVITEAALAQVLTLIITKGTAKS